MILIDASVLISYLRSASPQIHQVFVTSDCGVCGVTRAEILHGARTSQESEALREAVNALIPVPTPEITWDHLGIHLATFRSRGLPMPFQDVLLATIAIDHDADLWTSTLTSARFRVSCRN